MSNDQSPSQLADFLRDLETHECLSHNPLTAEQSRAIREAEDKLRQMPNWYCSGLWDVQRPRKEVAHD